MCLKGEKSAATEGYLVGKTRWAWYLLLTVIGTACTEGQSWATPVILADPFVPLVYGLHYLLIWDYLARRQALTLRTLAIGGLVVGFTTESLLTKVIWNPNWETGEGGRILGLHVFGTGFVASVWHTWLSMGLPFALALTCFGHSQALSKRLTRRILLLMPLTLWYSASVQDPSLIAFALPGIPLNLLTIAAAAWLYQRQARHALLSAGDMVLTRRERWIVWVLILLVYAMLTPHNAQALPDLGPFLLGMGLVGGSLWLLSAVARADQGRMTPPDVSGGPCYTPRRFLVYALYYAVAGGVLIALGALTQPASLAVTLTALLPLTLATDAYLLRLTWQVLPHRLSQPSITN